MNADQHIAQAAARAAIAYRNGDDLLGDHWTERVVRLSDKRELDAINEARTRDAITRLERSRHSRPPLSAVDLLRTPEAPDGPMITGGLDSSLHCPAFDELKGSPDHSVVRHA